jgi:actin-like ATPase involved in cell morphogenesis
MSEKKVIGIDFGTSTTLVSELYTNNTVLLNIEKNDVILETILRLKQKVEDITISDYSFENIESIIEERGKNVQQDFKDKGNIYYHFKPFIGEKNKEGEISNTLAEIWFKLIYKIIKNCANNANLDKYEFVIGVPAKWEEERINVIKRIAENSGFKKIHFFPEPVAAILSQDISSFFKKYENKQYILLIDFGGGTLDLCLMEILNGKINIMYSSGNPKLGGKDFDNRVNEHFRKEASIQGETNINFNNQNIKEKILEREEVTISYRNNLYTINREQFKKVCNAEIKQITEAFDEFFKELTSENICIDKKKIDAILKIGGASQLFFIDELIRKYFEKKIDIYVNDTSNINKHPYQSVVALGLPYYLTKREEILKNIKSNIKERYLKTKSQLDNEIKKYSKQNRVEFNKLFCKYEKKYISIFDEKENRNENMENQNRLLLHEAIQVNEKWINDRIKIAEDGLNELANETSFYDKLQWGQKYKSDGRIYSFEKLGVSVPDNLHLSLRNFYKECIASIIVHLIKNSEVKLRILKKIIEYRYLQFFSMKKPRKRKTNWEKEGGFFYQIKENLNFPSWNEFWNEFQNRFHI